MPALLIFVVVMLVVAVALIAAGSIVGSRRRTEGRQFDGQVRGFKRR